MNTDIRIPQTLTAQVTEHKPVCLNPVALQQAFSTVREIFFPEWQGRRHWHVELESGKPYLMRCDFVYKSIGMTKAHFADRDELRALLVVQLCIARLGYARLTELGSVLKSLERRAAFIQRTNLAAFIGESRDTLASRSAAEIIWDSNAVTTYDWPAAKVDANRTADAYDAMYTDSLADGDIQRILRAEKKYIRGL